MLTGMNAQLSGPFIANNAPPLYNYSFYPGNGANIQPAPSGMQGIRQPLGVPQGTTWVPGAIPQNQVLYSSNGTAGVPGLAYSGQTTQYMPASSSFAQTPYQQTGPVMPPPTVTGVVQTPAPSVTPSSVMAPPSSVYIPQAPQVGGIYQPYQPAPVKIKPREKKIIPIEDPETRAVVNKDDVEQNVRMHEEQNHRPPSSVGSAGRTPSPNAPSTLTPDTAQSNERLIPLSEGESIRTDFVGDYSTSRQEPVVIGDGPPVSLPDEEFRPPNVVSGISGQPLEAVPSPGAQTRQDFMNQVLSSVLQETEPKKEAVTAMPSAVDFPCTFGDFDNLEVSRGEEDMKAEDLPLKEESPSELTTKSEGSPELEILEKLPEEPSVSFFRQR